MQNFNIFLEIYPFL